MFDTLAIMILSLFGISGLMRGWLVVIGNLLSWLISLVIALMTATRLTHYLIDVVHLPRNLGAFLEIASAAFIFAVALVISTGFIRGSFFSREENQYIELSDKILGLFFGLIQGVAVLLVLYGILLGAFGPGQPRFLAVAKSVIYLDPMARAISDFIIPQLKGTDTYRSFLRIF
ncbi:MAG: CvpA family protein [Alphaproteobacteria bacterium]|nr:CvpA family protein [Alphaproteobacteria bacterium]